MFKNIALILVFFTVTVVAVASPFDYEICNLGYKHVHHKHNESSYQQAWCSMHDGIMEYENKDKTRVDCLTDEYAVEFDFANKWHESIGQALHYGLITGKKPMVVLILDNPQKQMIYYKRVKKIADKYKFKVEYITDDILKLDKDGNANIVRTKCINKPLNDNDYQKLYCD